MVTKASTRQSSLSIPVTLPQIAEGIRQLSKGDLETLELLLDKEAMATMGKSVAQARRGKMQEL